MPLLLCSLALGLLTANAEVLITFDGPGAAFTGGYSINTAGAVTGSYSIYADFQYHSHGFVRSPDGTFTTFDVPGALNAYPKSINTAGTITGYYYLDLEGPLAFGFVRSPNGAITTFSSPGSGPPEGTYPTSINAAGAVTGYYYLKGSHGFVLDPSGAFTTFDVPGASVTLGLSINTAGAITGSYGDGHGFVRDPSGSITTFDVPSTPYTVGGSINSAGAITGDSYTYDFLAQKTIYHGYLRAPDGTITTFDVPRAASTRSSDINTAGVITGYYSDANNHDHGFVRAPNGAITSFDVPGATDTRILSINTAGAITGYYSDALGFVHGFLHLPPITGQPVLAVSPSTLNFGYSDSLVSDPQQVTVLFSGGRSTPWTASSSQSNIVVSPPSGVGAGTIRVTVTPGPSGSVTINAPSADNSPTQIQVNIASVNSSHPFGSFDTPGDGAIDISGSVPTTGWALDSIGVTKVDIWREPVASESGGSGPNGLLYVGDAVFVAGARPDIEAMHPAAPFNYRAGWGYLLLTNSLPNSTGSGALGNGTYKLHAIAHNKAGFSTDLGTKTITVDNTHATKPFGTIDTPAPGGTASGNAYLNFGWALAQNPACIPNDGSTLTVYVDGHALPGHPSYNNKRNDIATLFPGFCNSNGAVGFYTLDTTQLANGVHTIAWTAFDNQNRGEGLGSRYFNVLNSSASMSAATASTLPVEAAEKVTLRRGFEASREEAIAHTDTGTYSLDIEELERVELHAGVIGGHLLVSDEERGLPVGSSIKDGVFYWQPGPGFLGEYYLALERANGESLNVHVTIRPKNFNRRVPPTPR